MAGNPADLLHRQLVAWNTSGNRTVAAHRQIDDDISLTIRRHAGALANLQSVRELLDEAEKIDLFPVGPYQDQIPEWGKMVLSIPHGWGGPSHAFNKPSLILLGTLAPQLRPLAPALPDGAVDTFEQALDKVLEALKLDESLPEGIRKYLLNLVIHMKLVIEEYRLDIRGDYDLSRAATLLKTTIDTAYEKSTDATSKKRWSGLRKVFSVEHGVQLFIAYSAAFGQLMLTPPPGN